MARMALTKGGGSVGGFGLTLTLNPNPLNPHLRAGYPQLLILKEGLTSVYITKYMGKDSTEITTEITFAALRAAHAG